MEIHAINSNTSRPFGKTSSSSFPRHGQSNGYKKPREKADPMRLRASDGQAICGVCKKTGQLTKTRYQNPESSQSRQVHSLTPTNNAKFAAVPIESNPIAAQNVASIHNLNNVSECNLVQALVDTGATISALRQTIATRLELQYDVSKVAAFTTAANKHVFSLCVVKIKAMLDKMQVRLFCHVVNNLAHELSFGYPDLKHYKITIDTDSDEVRFPKFVSTLSPAAPGICTMNSCLPLPGQSHTYVDINEPPLRSAFISTPNETVLKKMLSVAAGVVQSDADGIVTVKLANLDTDIKYLNKRQHIANFEYLSPTLKSYSNSDTSIYNIQTS
ncbi:uncharacterized protein EV154DRAFT_577747 [Mucor mucedo]|uniref:uncharacterized protein n=1 Tax=Mucor mucedo TaxID=29922 RepID=UPI0022209FEF|nr:uncharacterized protein EV154DRAFT_577747 [Mucor mucedo]KAI7875643.1 hypothetical protein EV154DRAFT_577747 [Mucor mucedo]